MSSRWRKTKAEIRRKYGKHGLLLIPLELIPDGLTLEEFVEAFRNWQGTVTFVRNDYEEKRIGKGITELRKKSARLASQGRTKID